MSKTKSLIEKMTTLAIPFEHYKLPNEVAKEICNVQPMAPNLIQDLEVALLPKHWEPKGEYIEVFSGKDHTYAEKIIRKSDMKRHIDNGWRITRLSKLSPSLVYKKWIHAIIAMENE